METVDQTKNQGSKITSALQVGSGVNIQELATSLSEAELNPKIEKTQGKITETEAKISALGLLKSSLSIITSALENLEDNSSITDFAASSSLATSVTAAADGNVAVPGTYVVQASQLATPTRIVSNSHSSQTASLNGGTAFDLSFNQGPSPGVTTAVTVTNPTPSTVVQAINTANLGISASLINKSAAVTENALVTFSAMTSGQTFTVAGVTVTASGDVTAENVAAAFSNIAAGRSINSTTNLSSSGTLTGWSTAVASGTKVRFTSTTAGGGVTDLSASGTNSGLLTIATTQGVTDEWYISVVGETGSQNQFTLSSTPDLGFSTNSNILSTAQNAVLSVNGIGSINRASNTVSDVVPGVSLDLIGTSSATITVTEDLSSLRTSIDNLVVSVNDFNTILKTMEDPDSTDPDVGGALSKDSSFVNLLRKKVRAALLDKESATASGSMTTLRDLGLAYKLDGDIEINETLYSNAITSSLSDVKAMLTANNDKQSRYDTAAKGLALESKVDLLNLTETDGLLINRESNADSNLIKEKDALTALEKRMAEAYTRYIKQFAAMESIVQRSKSTGDYLEGQFTAMENMYKK